MNIRLIKEKILPHQSDTPDKRYFKITIYTSIGLILFMIIASLVTFMLSLRGSEMSMVPDVKGMELVNALIELQQKELYPRIQLRFSSDPNEKGTIISQNPNPGALVKAGKRVTLVVSKGAVVDRVENYIGQNINEVKIHLQTLFTTYKPLLKIKEPVMYVYNDAPPGTILEQKPKPETEITGLTNLELVVSRGPKGREVTVENYVGLGYKEAVAKLAQAGIPFVFKLEEKESANKSGVIVSQEPAKGSVVPQGALMQFIMTKPRGLEKGEVFGLFQYSLPEYPVAVDMKFESVSDTGQRDLVFFMKHTGGAISIPYVQKEGTTLILSIYDKEVIRYTVSAQ